MDDPFPTSEGPTVRTGAQVDTALFSRVEQLIQRARLTQEERIAVETGSVASEVHVARKEFDMGHLDQAIRAVVRVSASFDQRVSQWENLARTKEQNKRNMSMLQIRKMNAEHSGVRTRVELVRAQLRRLRTGLDQLEMITSSQAVASEEPEPELPRSERSEDRSPQATHGPSSLPPGFLEALEAARDPEGRLEAVRQYFEIEAKLEVEIRKERGKDRVSFASFPVPPTNRFYVLLDTVQIIRTRRARVGDVIHVHYPESGRNGRMPLKDFVQHVQNGVWLLRPKSAGQGYETTPS